MKTIAIIDDDTAIGDMLQEVLQGEGYGVLRAYCGLIPAPRHSTCFPRTRLTCSYWI